MVRPAPRPTKPAKRARLDLKCPPIVREVLELAAKANGESLSAFILRAALGRARVTVMDTTLLQRAEQQLMEFGLRF